MSTIIRRIIWFIILLMLAEPLYGDYLSDDWRWLYGAIWLTFVIFQLIHIRRAFREYNTLKLKDIEFREPDNKYGLPNAFVSPSVDGRGDAGYGTPGIDEEHLSTGEGRGRRHER